MTGSKGDTRPNALSITMSVKVVLTLAMVALVVAAPARCVVQGVAERTANLLLLVPAGETSSQPDTVRFIGAVCHEPKPFSTG